MWLGAAAFAAAAILLGAVVLSRRRAPDTVDTFRRQIDALSPESRKPTLDRARPEEQPTDKERSDEEPSDEEPSDGS